MNNKIMIVDDDKELLEELDETLKANGYKVVPVREPSKILDLACSEKPDLILLDIKMDGMDGFEVAQKLKSSSDTSAIPIIGISGHFRSPEESSLMNMYGIALRLNKPVMPQDVLLAIQNIHKLKN